MNDNDLRIIVSMIIQDLRRQNKIQIINTIKEANYDLIYKSYDNWNGGINYYDLVFFLKYEKYYEIFEQKDEYEEVIQNSLNKFYYNESNIIQDVLFLSKIEQFIDWDALDSSETKEIVLQHLQYEKDLLIDVGTGNIRIQDVNDQYIKNHKQLNELLNKLCLQLENNYDDLWYWYNDYNERKLLSYQSRRMFIKNLYDPLIDTIKDSKLTNKSRVQHTLTGWEKVDDAIVKMKDILVTASITEDYQSVGMYGREILISLAQLVFVKDKHPAADGIDIGSADSKRMLEAYINYCLKHKSNPREIKFAKSAIDFANELTHNRTANSIDAELCYNAVITTVNIIRLISKYDEC